MRRALVAILFASLAVAAAGAHEGHNHTIMGTVASVHAASLDIKATTGKTASVPGEVTNYLDQVTANSKLPVCAGFGIRRRPPAGVLDHQVAVEGNLGCLQQRFHDREAEGQVRDEVRVHDVDVQPICAGDGLGFVGETREVGGQDGGGDHRVGHVGRV